MSATSRRGSVATALHNNVNTQAWEEVGRLNTPLDPETVKAPTPGDPAEALDKGTRRFLGVTIAVASIVALTHQSLTAALASARRDSALKAAYAMLTWPLPMTQPILAGVAAFVLLGIAVQTNGWRQVSARQGLLLGFVIAAVLGAGPMVLFCVPSRRPLFPGHLVRTADSPHPDRAVDLGAVTWKSRSSRGENIRAETVLAPACPFRAGRRGQPQARPVRGGPGGGRGAGVGGGGEGLVRSGRGGRRVPGQGRRSFGACQGGRRRWWRAGLVDRARWREQKAQTFWPDGAICVDERISVSCSEDAPERQDAVTTRQDGGWICRDVPARV